MRRAVVNSQAHPSSPLQAWLKERIGRGCSLLFAAHEYSQNCRCERCQLAITLDELSSVGIDLADCRWMVLEGIIEHWTETTYPGDSMRSFRRGDAILTKQSAFMLTQTGIQFLRCELQFTGISDSIEVIDLPQTIDSPIPQSIVSSATIDTLPRWDALRQELWFQTKLVKQFRIPSANQITILAAFEEDGWPSRIDDPLSCHAEIDSRRRLNDTIRNLNRSRIHPVLRFAGDGSGEGILWEPVGQRSQRT